MAKIIARLAIFFLLINLSTGMVMNSAIAQDLGIHTQVAGEDEVEEAVSQANETQTGNSGDETLFGLYNSVTGAIRTILDVMTAGPEMLDQLGVPGAITTVLQSAIIIIYGLGLASFIRGFELI